MVQKQASHAEFLFAASERLYPLHIRAFISKLILLLLTVRKASSTSSKVNSDLCTQTINTHTCTHAKKKTRAAPTLLTTRCLSHERNFRAWLQSQPALLSSHDPYARATRGGEWPTRCVHVIPTTRHLSPAARDPDGTAALHGAKCHHHRSAKE